ncbi:MAG: hypothetical protein WD066_14720 [Planctomycetaceae bacterium]
MKRIANYRSGDRAEAFGVVLMQLFCAVAPVPRPEDFGIVDAIGTLLRRDGRFLYAEDSLLLQFKSRTTTSVEYLGDRFRALLDQELALFIAHVDLTASDIKLYCIGPALAHPNIHDMKGLVAHFEPIKQRLEDGVLHTSLGDPVLWWSAKELADVAFEEKAHEIMKRWLEFERWNRRYRKMGMQNPVRWKTNEIPTPGGTTIVWNPRRGVDALEEIVPAIQMVGSLMTTDDSLIEPVLRIMSWLRSHGVEADPAGNFRLQAMMEEGRTKMKDALERCAEAEIAVLFTPVGLGPAEVAFWIQTTGRDGPYSAEKHSGSVDDLAKLGFKVTLDPEDRERISLELSDGWLTQRKCEVVAIAGEIALLRKRVENDFGSANVG